MAKVEEASTMYPSCVPSRRLLQEEQVGNISSMAKRSVNNTLSIYPDEYEYISNFSYTKEQRTSCKRRIGLFLVQWSPTKIRYMHSNHRPHSKILSTRQIGFLFLVYSILVENENPIDAMKDIYVEFIPNPTSRTSHFDQYVKVSDEIGSQYLNYSILTG